MFNVIYFFVLFFVYVYNVLLSVYIESDTKVTVFIGSKRVCKGSYVKSECFFFFFFNFLARVEYVKVNDCMYVFVNGVCLLFVCLWVWLWVSLSLSWQSVDTTKTSSTSSKI